MHPAPSVIFFSTFSGLGFGLLVFLGLGMPDVTGWTAFAFFTIAYLLAVGGLISSTFHLGHPERALRAFTQWRTSWLSREAWCAVAALVLMGLYGGGLVFLDQRWSVLGILGAIASLATVYTTSMIYGQLKTVPRWNSPLTSANFLSLCIAGGALLSSKITWAIVLLIVAGAVQIATWMRGDKALSQSGTNMETATGLGGIGSVRAFEPPHTGTNYLLREFVHVIGRKHAQKLRIISILLMTVLPVIFLLTPFSHYLALFAVLSHIGGVLTARWLFFAEAEHVVGLYYGKR
ncbi:dimethyl sulfoxide reductase anchor subunit family protein [Sulfitobacter donghicola]|uniref:Dibenzothiophene desulfurase n=1 Tax=Sulfitobacter donghicola DSW-25 = KCTC 12864 = JCM 14565 TaxID=1300350 RepID=A0A073IZN7_9RHOB|nr:DmsC/YnfH family molybdoenzyme membrane anchor subunit [Sulfitobacter donghicola]KEJ90882.1 dibenzothiophene desulfurase [Sulfitobacter donghicola DSW-25 = KCTC 12864 = JCM 14565]KIN68162.1 Anaerobic dimethyl sulfoxide reductase, C subunit [Sulfitobacter donghicola DSW-25 = KCTC 12864 = JCM 14565]